MKQSGIKRILLLGTATIVLSSLVGAAVQPVTPANDWENELVIGRNKEAPHANFHVFANRAVALRNDRLTASNFMLLNGDWSFNWVPTRRWTLLPDPSLSRISIS